MFFPPSYFFIDFISGVPRWTPRSPPQKTHKLFSNQSTSKYLLFDFCINIGILCRTPEHPIANKTHARYNQEDNKYNHHIKYIGVGIVYKKLKHPIRNKTNIETNNRQPFSRPATSQPATRQTGLANECEAF